MSTQKRMPKCEESAGVKTTRVVVSAGRSSGRITAKDYVILVRGKNARRSKYNNVPTVVGSIRFDSRKEAARWTELKQLEQARQIEELSRQVRCPLRVKGVRIGYYIADFAYQENGEQVLEDVKGMRTTLYRWKKKHVQAEYGITIRET